VIGVLNVLTGIFVERASELSGLDRDLVIQGELKHNEAFLSEMKAIFEEADTDGSGTINWQEFKEYVKNKEVRAYLSTQQLDAFDARQLFNILDLGDDQEVGIEEFILGCMRLKGMAKSVDVVAMLQETRAMHRKQKAFMGEVEDQLRRIASKVHMSDLKTLGMASNRSSRKNSFMSVAPDGAPVGSRRQSDAAYSRSGSVHVRESKVSMRASSNSCLELDPAGLQGNGSARGSIRSRSWHPE